MIIGIVAISKNYAIGKGGKLPWHYSADMKHFKNTTSGRAVAMGLNTWRSIGHPLPNRLNIVLSRSAQIEEGDGLVFLRSKEETLSLAKYLNCDLYIMGGAKTYVEFADVVDKWIVTEVPLEIEDADTFLPKDLLDGFIETGRKNLDEGLIVRELTQNQKLV
ncbi:MAG TPA: dihydrofolate reductase [Pyrinomonadaceae bacterium]|jgi:dihydrofolate reductase|nr:dihydrofolate reductase [Pyrinomonadaceae bacterium]